MKLELSKILEKLKQMVIEDGKVTQEELKFINSLWKDIELFQSSVNYVNKEKDISEDQLHDLIILRDGIFTNLQQFSTKSEVVQNLVYEIYTLLNDFNLSEGYEEEIRKWQELELIKVSDSNLTKDSKDLVAGLKYKPYDTNAILIVVFIVHIILIFVSWPILFVFDIIAFFSIFQIMNDSSERTFQRVYNHNKDIEKLKQQVIELSDQLSKS